MQIKSADKGHHISQAEENIRMKEERTRLALRERQVSRPPDARLLSQSSLPWQALLRCLLHTPVGKHTGRRLAVALNE